MLDTEAYVSPAPPEGKAGVAERALRSAIVGCVLMPGERLSETSLTTEFALGRGAVRAALARLKASGLVSSTARSGWEVAPISAAEIRELIAARRHLDPILCSAALDDAAKRRLTTLSQMHMALLQRPDLGGDVLPTIRRCERDMLDLLVNALGMPVVAGFLADLWDRSNRLVNFFERSGRAKFLPTRFSSFAEALVEGRTADAIAHLASANVALEAYLLDRFLETDAMVGRKSGRRAANKDKPGRNQRPQPPTGKTRTL